MFFPRKVTQTQGSRSVHPQSSLVFIFSAHNYLFHPEAAQFTPEVAHTSSVGNTVTRERPWDSLIGELSGVSTPNPHVIAIPSPT